MKRFLSIGVAGICLILPGVSVASTINFEVTGSGCTLLFDPHSSGPTQLPSPCYYRAYNCRIGDKPTLPVVVFTPPPPKIVTIPDDPNPPTCPKTPDTGPKTPDNPPVIVPVGPSPCPVAVPLPASSAMAGAGLAFAVICSWIRSRRQARA